ncbi:hypothetical protein PINS_up020850 [Pythium insidiosum]|nr:hypothetical protein PINS_up020850 [Pythium insidiosum]
MIRSPVVHGHILSPKSMAASSSPTDVSDHDALRPLLLPCPVPKTKRRTLHPEERASRRRKQHESSSREAAHGSALASRSSSARRSFSRARAEGAARETWAILNDPERYAKLYRTAIVVRVLQRVDDRTSIVVRNNPDHEQTTRLRSISLMRIVEDVTPPVAPSTTILVHVLPPQNEASVARQARRGVMYIRQGFTYMRFVRVDDESVEVTYGGMGQCPSEAHAVYLLVELGCTWFRWEQVVMPTRLVTP